MISKQQTLLFTNPLSLSLVTASLSSKTLFGIFKDLISDPPFKSAFHFWTAYVNATSSRCLSTPLTITFCSLCVLNKKACSWIFQTELHLTLGKYIQLNELKGSLPWDFQTPKRDPGLLITPQVPIPHLTGHTAPCPSLFVTKLIF